MKVHFIAIGGSVMHQLALALRSKEYEVSGSDDEIFEPAASNLAAAGLLPAQMGWFPEKVTTALDAVIVGMHARQDNPELQRARELGIPAFSFPEYIYRESQDKKRVVIGGSHGKTTTTSMIMHVLQNHHQQFDYMVGARLAGFERSVNISEAPVIVCEGDEYPASVLDKRPKFHFLFPHVAVITGIAWDHINIFPTFENYLEQFRLFIDKIEPGGILIYNAADETLARLVEAHPRKDIRYQPYNLPVFHIHEGITTVTLDGVEAALQVFGNHNLLNLQAAYAVCRELGLDATAFLQAMTSFTGAARRLELLAEGNGNRIYRDFAHAPSKVKASIEAVKQQYPDKKLIGLLELHTFSSLNEQFMQEYRGAMDKADVAGVFYSGHALELKRMPPLPPEKVLEGFNKPGLAVLNTRPALENWLQQQDYTGAVLLLMSSGNYDGLDMLTFARQLTGNTA